MMWRVCVDTCRVSRNGVRSIRPARRDEGKVGIKGGVRSIGAGAHGSVAFEDPSGRRVVVLVGVGYCCRRTCLPDLPPFLLHLGWAILEVVSRQRKTYVSNPQQWDGPIEYHKHDDKKQRRQGQDDKNKKARRQRRRHKNRGKT
jgi:hypothetical protein